ncbi:MAG: serine/threonine protein kinase [Ktedonobacteraceae bacterium]
MSTGPRRLGKYELHERLGRGGMAEVWKALDIQLERYVAIKLLHADLENDPDFMKRFIREAQVVASLHHPNIVQVHDFQTSPSDSGNTTAYMVMDYVQGQTLTEYIRSTSRVGNFPPASEIVHLFACISSAIDYAHQRGMIHRDIKPANILLDQRNPSRYQMGMPILTDFGIVKLLGVSTNTLTGWWLGTPLYISPEQAQGHPGNERSDIYSLGVILYEICTGVRPFQGDNPVAIIMQHISTTPTPPDLINPQITPALANVITRGLAKDPAARFPSASSMAAALADAFNMSTPANLHPSAPTVSALSEQTPWNPAQADLPASMTPSSPASTLPTIEPSAAPTPIGPLRIVSPSESTPTTPARGISGSYSIPNPDPNLPGTMPSQQLSRGLLPSPGRRRRGLLPGSIALLILILVGSSLGTLYLLSHRGPVAAGTPQIVGHASYISGDPSGESSSQGIDNELQIDLFNIPSPAPGKSYYAWLLSDNQPSQAGLCGPPTPTTSILLGPLSVDHATIHFQYPGNQQHANLIGITSRLLITEESGSGTPGYPSTDRGTWRYYAELPQTPNPTDQSRESALDHLRCLLYANADLQSLGINDGLDTQFFRNTKSVWEWAISAKNSTSPAFIHSQIIRILDYLDGAPLVQTDVPDIQVQGDQALAQVPLLDLNLAKDPTSYLVRINTHLHAICQAPRVTPETCMLATEADEALTNMKTWFQEIHQDAKQLVMLSGTQLLQPSSLSTLNNMETEANYAYSGLINSSTGKAQFGALQIDETIQRLATFDVRAYTPR